MGLNLIMLSKHILLSIHARSTMYVCMYVHNNKHATQKQALQSLSYYSSISIKFAMTFYYGTYY